MTDLIIGGETFRVEIEGDPMCPALVLSHALGTDLRLWDAQMPALRKHFRVIRYDSRGHGGSAAAAGPVSIGKLGRDVLRILDALEIERAHFAGISMGGAVGQWLLARARERLERVVLACTAARFGTPEAWNARILAVLGGGMPAIAAGTMDRWFSPGFTHRAPGQIDAIRATFLNTSPAGYVACCAALRDMDLRESLRGIDVPVLVVTGAADPVVNAADTASLLSALANVRHLSLDARHIANIEAADAFTDTVVAFLTAKIPARRKRSAIRLETPETRGKAARRSTAARRPVGKTTSARRKGPAAKPKAAVRKARKPASPRRPSRRDAAPTLRPKVETARPGASKRSPAKSKRPAEPTRRPPRTAAARGAVKKTAAKTKAGKAPTKKKMPKAPSAKRSPAPRRTPVKTPRRPSGRPKT